MKCKKFKSCLNKSEPGPKLGGPGPITLGEVEGLSTSLRDTGRACPQCICPNPPKRYENKQFCHNIALWNFIKFHKCSWF